jgi:hypothetical protein
LIRLLIFQRLVILLQLVRQLVGDILGDFHNQSQIVFDSVAGGACCLA